AGCKKEFDDKINGETPDQRIAAAMATYQDKLVKAPYGWIMLETTTGTAFNQGVSESGPVATFAYYMEFAANNKVSMFSDFDTSMAAVPKVSDFRLKSLQRPALIFDTYSYLHVPCDPDPRISKSPFGVGYGWGTDFEFSFADNVSASSLGDTIRLTGNLNSASAVLVKATKAQHDAYFAGSLKANMLAWASIQNYFKRVTSGATQFEITPGLGGDKSVDINWLDAGGALKSANSSIYFLSNSVNLVKPATIGTQTVNRFENLVFDAGTSTITAAINGNTPATIAGDIAPLKNDANAPQAWYNKAVNAGVYWVTETNFHVNGKDDAYNVAGIPAYAGFSIFYPKFGVSGGINYDLFSPIVIANGGVSIGYGFAYRPPVFTAAGTVVFPPLGTLGTVPPAANPAFANTRSKIAEATGYYLVLKEDNLTYDMVNVADAKAWVRWQWVF
ncbi:MAG TPA: DUF4302 domain-containing protein, partial [Chitinophagaceae bacterium]|nr:DUF4302 domain-containing protein [Chitinophagaceae bacterium]